MAALYLFEIIVKYKYYMFNSRILMNCIGGIYYENVRYN